MYILALSLMLANADVALGTDNDREIKQLIIKESVMQYPGRCPCPYFTDKAGRRCGGRSAWSRKGGYSPICYENEVTPEMVEQYRREHPYGVY